MLAGRWILVFVARHDVPRRSRATGTSSGGGARGRQGNDGRNSRFDYREGHRPSCASWEPMNDPRESRRRRVSHDYNRDPFPFRGVDGQRNARTFRPTAQPHCATALRSARLHANCGDKMKPRGASRSGHHAAAERDDEFLFSAGRSKNAGRGTARALEMKDRTVKRKQWLYSAVTISL